MDKRLSLETRIDVELKSYDAGTISTPYGKYVIVLFNKEFSDAMYYPEHLATVFGSKVSRLVFDQFLALEGRLVL